MPRLSEKINNIYKRNNHNRINRANVIYSNEMVNDIRILTKYSLTDPRFYLKMQSLEDQMDALRESSEMIMNNIGEKCNMYVTLHDNYSLEMANFYAQSTEAPDIKGAINALKENAGKWIGKIIAFISGIGKKLSAYAQQVWGKIYVLTYNKYKKSGNLNMDAKVKSSGKLKSDAYEKLSKSLDTVSEIFNIVDSNIKRIISGDSSDIDKLISNTSTKINSIPNIDNYVETMDGESTVKEVLGSEKNIELISSDFLKTKVKTYTNNLSKFTKMLSSIDKSNLSNAAEPERANERIKNIMKVTNDLKNRISSDISLIMNLSKIVNTAVKAGLGNQTSSDGKKNPPSE